MDIRSGFFKAPVSGIWSFTFSGGVKLKKNKGIKGRYGLEIVKNDDEMLGYLYKRSDSSRVSYGPVSMTVLVNLEVGIVAQAILQFKKKHLKPKITQRPISSGIFSAKNYGRGNSSVN